MIPHKPNPGWTTPAKIKRVIDGDTLVVEVTRTIHVRLLDCWAPESRTKDAAEKKRGLAAKEHLKQLIEGSRAGGECLVMIPTEDNGDLLSVMTMGRLLGYVWVGGEERSLSEQQVLAGHATRTKEG